MLGLQDLPGPLAHRCGLRSSERLHNVVFPELACSEFFRCRAWRAGAALLETLVCWLELERLALMAKALLRVTLTYFFNSCSGQSSAIKIFQGREKRQMKKKGDRKIKCTQTKANASGSSLGLLGIPTCLLPTRLLPGPLSSLVLTCTMQMPACLALLPIPLAVAESKGGRKTRREASALFLS